MKIIKTENFAESIVVANFNEIFTFKPHVAHFLDLHATLKKHSPKIKKKAAHTTSKKQAQKNTTNINM